MRPHEHKDSASPEQFPNSTPAHSQIVWTAESIRALGASTDLATAASVLGMSRSTAYKLIRRDAFPVPHFRVGAHYRIPTTPLLAALHLLDTPAPAEASAATDTFP
ncbi:helix-turn-helix domain-containing protein [Micromonospora sp. WMMD710]|uniref:helix-turn-helix domain-containing protein n=1 Tax=Micromonospora sp. WMMD710 TaxID=3016085 RepID=UPI0024174918|nr:helix-turn-helix domain-containing protein [Micromonospora sp. WMMD710]MDG4760481.1 helix-turn-helix domain-containing protein [Micromonospora sp. WMMD710]